MQQYIEVDVKQEIPDSKERRSYNEPCSWSVLCKEDKDQLDRIEKLLRQLLEKPSEEGFRGLT